VRAALADRYLPDGLRSGTPLLQGTQAEMISTDGDRDHWEARILVSDPKSASEIIGILGNRIKAGTSHTHGPMVVSSPSGNRSASSSQIRWKFKDDQGRDWRGFGAAEASSVEKDKFVLSVKLTHVG